MLTATLMGVSPPGELYQYSQVLLKLVVEPPLAKVKVKVLVIRVCAWAREAEHASAKAATLKRPRNFRLITKRITQCTPFHLLGKPFVSTCRRQGAYHFLGLNLNPNLNLFLHD